MRPAILLTILYFLLLVTLDSKHNANACGPYFPEHLIRHRVRTLNYLPVGTFAWEARYFIAPPNQLLFNSNSPQKSWGLTECFTKPIGEVFPWLKPALYGAADSARAATSGQQALALGARLPVDLRWYLSGAAEFRSAISTDSISDTVRVDRLYTALHFFDSITAQSSNTTQNLIVRATYMRGECFKHIGSFDSAAIIFRKVQKLVSTGYPDPLALGLSSLGEEALALLRQGMFVDAVHCYALQAACTPDTGLFIDENAPCVVSLEYTAHLMSINDSLFRIAIRDTVCQKMFCAYHYSDNWYSLLEHSSNDATCRWNSIVETIDKYSTSGILGSEMLAAAAYREGCFEAAKKLAARSNTALTLWVRAKLYIRSGEFDSADAAFAKAAKLFSDKKLEKYNRTWLGDVGFAPAWTRAVGEYATLEVCRGHYAHALNLLYDAGEYYWVDVAYIAERIFTIDELSQFVDSVAPKNAFHGETDKVQYPSNPQLAIRSLFARRLIREGQCDKALKFFDDPRIKPYAVAYCTTFARSREGSDISRAQNLFNLGKLANKWGMELMGYELDPDWAFEDGRYDESDYKQEGDSIRRIDPFQSQPKYATEDEKQRILKTEARPNKRFHYRFRAIDYALQAAALLPHGSQAYSAVLWNAWSWINNSDRVLADSIYKLYLKHGSSKYPFDYAIPDFGQAERMLSGDVRKRK